MMAFYGSLRQICNKNYKKNRWNKDAETNPDWFQCTKWTSNVQLLAIKAKRCSTYKSLRSVEIYYISEYVDLHLITEIQSGLS